jgi:aspartate-semialdehyde dehydrogenase
MTIPKIPVGILGATGSVGQKFVELLADHPWFEITALAASERSAGKAYREAANWFQSSALPERIGDMTVSECVPTLPCRIVFSGLDASVAGEIEESFAKAGYVVVSNSKNHRWDADVPLLIPEVNPDHLDLVRKQAFSATGMIVTNPNCSAVGLVMALKPLADAFGLEDVSVVTMQAISGAGYPGVASLDILDNVIPFIGGEEEKLEREPLRILGTVRDGQVDLASFRMSAQCNRVAVIDGHTECVAVRLKKKATFEEIVAAWRSFRSAPQELSLPMAPTTPIVYHDGEKFPQPKLHRNLDKGMAVSVGRLRPDSIFDWKFVVLSHNTIRGAAGGAILNAELMVARNLISNF